MKKGIGLVEQIREFEANKPKVSLEDELSKPYRKPNTDTILCGIELANELNKVLNDKRRSKRY